MNLCTVSNVEEMCNYMDSIFNTALINKADRIVFLQSRIKANIFAICYLKQDNYGNESVISLYDNILEIDNNDILYEVINKFKEEYNDIPIDVWSDILNINTDISYETINKIKEKYNKEMYNYIPEVWPKIVENEKFDNVYNTKEIRDKITVNKRMKIGRIL